MAQKITMDLELRFIDNATSQAKSTAKALDTVEKEAKEAAQELDKLDKKKPKPTVDADTSKVDKKLDKIDKSLRKIDKMKPKATIDADDRATAKITKALDKARRWAGKKFSAFLELKDSGALRTLEKMSNGLRDLTRKVFRVPVKILDYATRPLRALKNTLFSIKGLVAAITAGFAAKQLVLNPINLADAYSSAKIGFSTLLGESRGQQMMDELDEFAKVTPFKTSGVIANAQKMMAMGWDPENIIDDLGIIGDAAAATGKLDQGLESIVRAMSQIKTKGRLSTEELNQLAEAGIAAKAMLAEGLGYGTGDAGIAKMTEDLEEGLIASDVAIEALLKGMQRYDGMMESMANETVEGLWSQIQDVFEINIFRKWGQGLQDGAKRGFGTVIQLLDEAEEGLGKFGDMLYEIGKTASNWVADKLQGVVDRVTKITDTYEFQNAGLKEKISMLWHGVIVDPLQEWWDNGGREKTAETAGKIGSWMGEMLTKGLLALFGATNVLDEDIGTNAGSSIAGSFLDGFLANFDGQAITDAFVEAISNVWGALPWWAKTLIGGYGIGKAAGGIANFAGGVANFVGGVKNVIGDYAAGTGLIGLVGSTGNYMVSGTGILGKLAGAGYALTGGPASAGAYFGAGMSGGTAALIGAGGIAGGVVGGASLIKGGVDLYKGYHTDDVVEAKALKASGNTAVGATLAGAAIGTAIAPGIGTLIGAGIGGLAGWIGGDAWANNIRAAKYESEEMKEAIKDSEMSAEELANVLAKAKWENAKKHFGDMKLSLSEIERLADQIVWGGDIANYEQFTTSVQAAEESLTSMKSSAETINRWMWKAGLGVTFNDDEKESIVASFDEYIASAKAVVENKHYEFAAAVSLLVDVESEGGKSIMDSGNAFYGKYKEDLNAAGEELGKLLTESVADGFINAEEQAAIAAAQQKIAEITEKIANAEQQAELDLINVKFGEGNLDYDSFENFMAQMQSTIDERVQASDKAFVASVSSLNLQLADGAITQEEYDKQLQTLIDGYTGTVEGLQAQVKDVELNIIGEAYADELGSDAASDLQNALEYAIQHQMDPIEISDETMARLLKIENLDENGETISNLKEMLSGVLGQLELLEVDGDLLIKVGEVQTEEGTNEKITEALKVQIPDPVEEDVTLQLDGNPEVLKMLTADELATLFGIAEPLAQTIWWKLKPTTTVEEQITLLASDFGLKGSYTFNPSVNINPSVTTSAKSFTLQLLEGNAFRGGLFGTGGVPGFSDGGMVRGGAQLIKVAEEGSPEMVIPLSSQRRQRGLDLWEKAGQMLRVPGFFRGGRTDGGDEGIRFMRYGSGEASGGQTIQVDVGGVKVEIHVNSDGSANIVEAVKAQLGEITDAVVGAIADELGAMFENTPVRGGA